MSQSGNDFSVQDKNGNSGPSSQLDIYSEAIDSTVDDEFLDDINLGLGNYSKKEYWQQVESFRFGMFADKAFGRRLRERAIEETKHKLALDGWRYYVEDEDEVYQVVGWNDLEDEERAKKDRRRYIEQRGDEIWDGLPEEERYDALVELTGVTRDWTPPHWRMMMMRHEASRSIGARLLDNLFGRVKEIKDSGAQAAKETLQKLGGS